MTDGEIDPSECYVTEEGVEHLLQQGFASDDRGPNWSSWEDSHPAQAAGDGLEDLEPDSSKRDMVRDMALNIAQNRIKQALKEVADELSSEEFAETVGELYARDDDVDLEAKIMAGEEMKPLSDALDSEAGTHADVLLEEGLESPGTTIPEDDEQVSVYLFPANDDPAMSTSGPKTYTKGGKAQVISYTVGELDPDTNEFGMEIMLDVSRLPDTVECYAVELRGETIVKGQFESPYDLSTLDQMSIDVTLD